MDPLPFFQFGEGSPALGWFYERRAASWDGVVFKNKAFVRNLKAPVIMAENPFDKVAYEMGWWKLHGAQFAQGRFDFDAATDDDVHYAMTKVLANDSSIGVQLSSFVSDHQRLEALLDLIGTYNLLIAADIAQAVVPSSVKTSLQPVEAEAEVRAADGGYQIVEKKVFERTEVLDASGASTFTIHNPFDSQPVVLELRPRFDYLPWVDPEHALVSDFAASSGFPVSASDSSVQCTLQDGGRLSIVKSGDSIGHCTILVPGTVDMTFRRGIGLAVEADGKSETVIVQASNGAWGFRAFRTVMQFSGTRELVLGDPTTDTQDPVQGAFTTTNGDEFRRSWDYDYGIPSSLSVRVSVKDAGDYSLRFTELKALQENVNVGLQNPRVVVNGESVDFTTELYPDDTSANILAFDGSVGSYGLYTSNHALLETVSRPTDARLESGDNEVTVLADPGGLHRLDLRLTAYAAQPLFTAGDECPDDPAKLVPGVCGCGVSDADTNANGTPDCLDGALGDGGWDGGGGAGGAAEGGPGADAGADASGMPPGTEDVSGSGDGGCSCRSVGGAGRHGALLAAAFVWVLALARRRTSLGRRGPTALV